MHESWFTIACNTSYVFSGNGQVMLRHLEGPRVEIWFHVFLIHPLPLQKVV